MSPLRVVALAALLGALGCKPRASAPRAEPGTLSIYFTAGGGRMGLGDAGLDRLAGRLAAASEPHLLVDAGGLLFPSEQTPSTPQTEAAAALTARVYRRLGVAALNLGRAELAAGAGFLKRLQAEGATPLVSANLRPRSGGPTVARAYVRRVAGVAVGITGVAAPSDHPERGALTVLEPASAVAAQLRALRQRGAQRLIILADLDAADAAELAEAAPEADVIIYSRPGPSPAARAVAGVRLIAARPGQLGQLRLRLPPGDARRLRWPPSAAPAPAAEIRSSSAAAHSQAPFAASSAPAPNSPTAQLHWIPLDDHCPSDPSTRAALDAHTQGLRP